MLDNYNIRVVVSAVFVNGESRERGLLDNIRLKRILARNMFIVGSISKQ